MQLLPPGSKVVSIAQPPTRPPMGYVCTWRYGGYTTEGSINVGHPAATWSRRRRTRDWRLQARACVVVPDARPGGNAWRALRLASVGSGGRGPAGESLDFKFSSQNYSIKFSTRYALALGAQDRVDPVDDPEASLRSEALTALCLPAGDSQVTAMISRLTAMISHDCLGWRSQAVRYRVLYRRRQALIGPCLLF